MWSPTSSVTLDYSNNTITTVEPRPYYYAVSATEESRYYYHEPVMYPAYCMLCGLPHNYHHTATKPLTAMASSAPMITPTPSNTHLPTLVIERAQSKINKKRLLKLQRPSRKYQKSQHLVAIMRKLWYKVLNMCNLVVQAPLSRVHDIYPTTKHQHATDKKIFH